MWVAERVAVVREGESGALSLPEAEQQVLHGARARLVGFEEHDRRGGGPSVLSGVPQPIRAQAHRGAPSDWLLTRPLLSDLP